MGWKYLKRTITVVFSFFLTDLKQKQFTQLTSLVGGDVNRGKVRCIGTLVGDSIDSLNLKAVLGVSLKVSDRHVSLSKPKVAGRDIHVVITPCAGTTFGQTFLTDDVIEKVLPSTLVTWLAPLEYKRCLIYTGDYIAWS